MKTLKYIVGAFVLAVGLSACVGDLNVTPIDPQMNTADKALQTEADYFSLLTQCYAGFSHSGSYGPNGNNNISGIDGGFSQYFRGRYHLNGLTTDEAVCGWNDQTLQDLHGLAWTTTDVFVAAFYYRIFYQISACNEFLRKVDAATIELPEKEQWKAEAKALRAFCWLEAIDNYGNVPFADETAPVGAYVPEQIKRADLFTYIETELKALIADDSALYAVAAGEYGRINKGAALMMLAKLYLNAEVYIGQAKYQECADVLAKLDGAYSLHTTPNGTKFSAFQDLFLADNHKCTEEIIWAIEQDGVNVQSYGVTNYLIFASTGGKMDTNEAGISSGWGGLRTTPEFYQKFSSSDARNLFHTKDHQAEIDEIGTFTHGYAFTKFRNVQSDGVIPNQTVTVDEKTGEEKRDNPGFVNTDFPVFRYADALLMKAECAARGASVDGLAALNAVRKRAGLGEVASYELAEVLDERARELAQEGWRRQDLIRFGKFTTADYLWQWKGGVKAGKAVGSHMNLFPIPETDKNANANLVQNLGY